LEINFLKAKMGGADDRFISAAHFVIIPDQLGVRTVLD
jgi:hypothetical protein